MEGRRDPYAAPLQTPSTPKDFATEIGGGVLALLADWWV